MTTLKKIFPTEDVNKIIVTLTAWQFLSVALMAVGTWPAYVAITNAILLSIFILFAKPYHSVLLLTLSIPFYIILPNPYVENLPMWRVLFVLLFVVWFVRLLFAQKERLKQIFEIQHWHKHRSISFARARVILTQSIKRIDSRFMIWDRAFLLLFILAMCSLIFSRFPIHGLKQIIFVFNIYLLYVVIINVVTDETKLKELIKYTFYSLGIMLALGYVQYIGTLFALPYYFWQYWATMVSSLYYGQSLASVLIYSNSWFSSDGSGQALRMFGVLPDTHAFGVISIFFLAFLIPLKNAMFNSFDCPRFLKWLWYGLVIFAGFGVMANGTRGVWLSMLAPLALTFWFYWRKSWSNGFRTFFKTMLMVYMSIIVLFVVSPYISTGLNFIRSYNVDDNFLNRASSIYDLSENSNAGRIDIWKNSVKFSAMHPFGTGYGNFITSIVQEIPEQSSFEDVSTEKNLRYNLPQAFVTAHSLYLQLLVELGFAGLLLFAVLLVQFFGKVSSYLEYVKSSQTQFTNLVISLSLAFVWILAYGVFDLTILNDRVLQYLLISMAICGLIFVKYHIQHTDTKKHH